jgi:putative ABC transport system substrate-binding protein
MKRRTFIAGLGSAAAWTLAARAQQRSVPAIGYLSALTEEADRPALAGYRRGLGEQGYVEGRNVEIVYHYANGELDRFRGLAEELVHTRASVICAGGAPPPALEAAKTASATTPYVFFTGVDPVQSDLVASLNRPGSNATGATFLTVELVAKRIELLHELAPTTTSIGVLALSRASTVFAEAENAARVLGVGLVVATPNMPGEIGAAVASLVDRGIGALEVGGAGLFQITTPQLVALAASHKLPTIYTARRAVEAGGLMSYGANIADAARIAGNYTGRILKGEKPADLPVQRSTRIETVLNLKTAKALGLTIPETLLATADEVIQ